MPFGAVHLGQDLVSPQDNQTKYQYTYDNQQGLNTLGNIRGVFLEVRAYTYSMRMFHPLTLSLKG